MENHVNAFAAIETNDLRSWTGAQDNSASVTAISLSEENARREREKEKKKKRERDKKIVKRRRKAGD